MIFVYVKGLRECIYHDWENSLCVCIAKYLEILELPDEMFCQNIFLAETLGTTPQIMSYEDNNIKNNDDLKRHFLL